MSQLHVYRNSVVDHVVAESPEDAAAIMRVQMGVDDDDGDGDLVFVQEDDAKILAIHEDYDGGPVERRTCREWADTHGRGFLCSTEF